MRYPNLNEERKLWKKGFKFVVGLDEAGRGALCGPVVAAAVCLINKEKFKVEDFDGLKDSKRLLPKTREKFFRAIIENPHIEWGIGKVSEKIIDKINILEATKLAMEKAVNVLERKIKENVDFLILDGNFKISLPIPQKSIVKADEKIFSCTLASIIAKVSRDKMMLNFHLRYPQYGFNKNKGYPTQYHLKLLKKIGHCKIHRKSFLKKVFV